MSDKENLTDLISKLSNGDSRTDNENPTFKGRPVDEDVSFKTDYIEKEEAPSFKGERVLHNITHQQANKILKRGKRKKL